jgi:hypothetical protein
VKIFVMTVAALALTATPAAAVLTAAPTVAAGSWKTTLTAQLRGDDGFSSIAVGAKTSAWALGVRHGNDQAALLAYHWDGRTWKRAAVPALPASKPGDIVSDTTVLSASSARNAWAAIPGEFAIDDREEPDPCDGPQLPPIPLKVVKPSLVLHWNGDRFVRARLLKDVVISSIVATGTTSAWAFGSSYQGAVTLHYDGRRWTRTKSTFAVTAATRVGKQIWAYGESAPNVPAIQRFDGHRWKPVPTGDRIVNRDESAKAAGRQTDITSIAALPHGQVMIGGHILHVPACSADTGPESVESFIYRWTGKSWHRESPARVQNYQLRQQIPAPHGATYALAEQLWDPEDSHPDVYQIFYRTSQGRWTTVSIGLRAVKAIAFLRNHLTAAGSAEGPHDTNATLWTHQ